MAENGTRPTCNLEPFIIQLREVLAEARELLKEPMPDTFLGRKTQEPFPKEQK